MLQKTLSFCLLMLASCNNQTQTTISASENNASAKTDVDLSYIKLPRGFTISIFANVPDARSLCLTPSGTLFVGNRSGDKVYAVTDVDKNGVADKVYTIATGLTMPCGVAFKDGSLYVAEVNRILRFDKIEEWINEPKGLSVTNQEMQTPPPPYKVVYDKLPTDRHHGWKFIAFGPDGKLYVPVGAPCNICEEKNPVYASITRMNADGSGFEIFAQGIRNTVGFDWNPQTKQLWFTDNGGDNLGDNLPADELNVASQKGMHFGFPYCHQGDVLDKKFGSGKDCSQFTAPAIKLGPHVAALGMRFYTGKQFPSEYQNQIFIAEHGSWNRSTPLGYRVMLVKLQNGKAVSYAPFAEGWLQSNGKVLGRPVDVQVAPDGSLYVSDDMKGVIYRISYK